MPLDESGTRFTLGFDPVTVPKEGAAADLVTEQVGSGWRGVYLGEKFRALSARAGIALSPLLRDRLVGYCPVINTSPANWWYALLFAVSGQTVARRDGESVVHERELIVQTPLLFSVDLIQRFHLNTDDPGLPAGMSLVRQATLITAKQTLDGSGRSDSGGGEIQSDDAGVPNKLERLATIRAADKKAYFTYAYAETNLGHVTDKRAYEWLKDNGLPDEVQSPELANELAGYELPAFPTWAKQVRNARKVLGEQKYEKRADKKPGRSIVSGRGGKLSLKVPPRGTKIDCNLDPISQNRTKPDFPEIPVSNALLTQP